MRPAPQTALLTLDEAAARLHVSRRWLQGFLRGKPYGKMAGRKRLFTEIDVAAIYEELPCSKPLASITAGRRITSSATPTGRSCPAPGPIWWRPGRGNRQRRRAAIRTSPPARKRARPTGCQEQERGR